YRILDPVTGLAGGPLDLGALPLESATVPEGFLRIVVEPDGGPGREFTRLAQLGSQVEIDCRIRPGTSAFAGMVKIPAGRLAVPEPDDGHCPFRGTTVDVPSFWLDEAKVSIGEYRAFLAATKHPLPEIWKVLPDDARMEDRPCVGISWPDARAYAEWVGKRLGSHAEWELAGRGPEGARFN